MIPDPHYVATSITDALRNTNPLLDAIAQARTRADEATAATRAIKQAMADLEDDAAFEALEDPQATNDAKRKAVAARFLRECVPYQQQKAQLAEALRAETVAKAELEDRERRLKTHERALPALVAMAEMVCHAEARTTAQIKLEGQRLYLKGGQEYRAAAEAQLAARQGAARVG